MTISVAMHYSAVAPLCHRSVMVRPPAVHNLLQHFFVGAMTTGLPAAMRMC